MDRWQEHVRSEINLADADPYRLLDIMHSLTSMDSHELIPMDISVDLFDLIALRNE